MSTGLFRQLKQGAQRGAGDVCWANIRHRPRQSKSLYALLLFGAGRMKPSYASTIDNECTLRSIIVAKECLGPAGFEMTCGKHGGAIDDLLMFVPGDHIGVERVIQFSFRSCGHIIRHFLLSSKIGKMCAWIRPFLAAGTPSLLANCQRLRNSTTRGVTFCHSRGRSQ